MYIRRADFLTIRMKVDELGVARVEIYIRGAWSKCCNKHKQLIVGEAYPASGIYLADS